MTVTPTNPAPMVCGTIKARADLIRAALRFADLAAGEGIEIDGLAPEDFLTAYSEATGDEDWDTIADRIAAIQPATAQPVAWRWRPKGGSVWLYDPNPEWLARQSRDEIDAEPIYAAPVAGDAVSVQEAARVLVRAWDADTFPVENPDPMLPAFIAILRALGGETA